MDPISTEFQQIALQRAVAKSETLRKEIKRISAEDSPRILRRLSRDRAEMYLQIMHEVGYLSNRERRAAVIWIEREYVKRMPPAWRDW